jgi:ornithine cyclodeaminase/alanine dehydrogenase-like protein (mu-crystallin family)
MTLILTEKDVRSVLTMKDGIRIVEEAFGHYARGRTTLAPRMVMKLEGDAGTFRIMAAIVPDMGGFGLKTLTGTPGKRKPGSTYFAMLYFDVGTAALLALIPATHITGIRTGAASGVATKYLAREDARTVGLFGAGFQGRNQVAAIREVRPVSRVTIFDVVDAPARALAKELEADGIEATIAGSPEETVRGSDIIASATTASEPPIRGEWLDAGTHVNAVGANAPTKREVDAEAFSRARVVVDFEAQVLQEAGDLIAAIESGNFSKDGIHAELGDVVIGKKKGRESRDQITLFKSVGVAIEDVAVAAWVYGEAKKRGLGTDVNLQD